MNACLPISYKYYPTTFSNKGKAYKCEINGQEKEINKGIIGTYVLLLVKTPTKAESLPSEVTASKRKTP